MALIKIRSMQQATAWAVLVCGQIAARRPEIKGAVLLMPCNVGRIGKIDPKVTLKTQKSWKMY